MRAPKPQMPLHSTRRARAALSLVALSVAFMACEKTGALSTADATDAGETPGLTAPHSLSYTPEGCSYVVRTPEVDEATMGDDAVGAAPAPDHVHVSFAGPTDSSFAVNWRTDLATHVTRVVYGTDEAAVRGADDASGTGLAAVSMQRGHTLVYGTTRRTTGTRVHEAHVCGLAASTRYFYKVGGPGHWSDVFDVSTGPSRGSTEPWSFGVTGDSRNDNEAVAGIMRRMREHTVDFQVFSGDAVVLGTLQDDWNGFFEAHTADFAVQELYARVPFMPCNGNHDAFAVNYLAQFALPQDITEGELGEGEEWYAFDYANAHFVVLNDTPTSRAAGAQTEWLRRDLSAVDRGATPWVFVVHHVPAYSSSTNHGSNLDVRSAWQPVFDQFGVDLVFNGHDHNYERSKPIRGFQAGSANGELAPAGPNGAPVDGSGTVYVVAAGSGAPLYGAGSEYFTQTSESTRNFVVVEIAARALTMTAYRDDGTVLDRLVYTKSVR